MLLVRLGLRPDNEESVPMHPARMKRFVERAQVKEQARLAQRKQERAQERIKAAGNGQL